MENLARMQEVLGPNSSTILKMSGHLSRKIAAEGWTLI